MLDKISKPIGLLMVSVALTTVATWFIVDHTKNNWGMEFWSVIGTNLSIIGLGFTLYQIWQIKKESRTIAITVQETKNKLFDLTKFGDLSKAVKTIQEIQSHTRGQKYEIAVMRLQDLKIIVGGIVSVDEQFSPASLTPHIESINFTIYELEKEIEAKGGRLRIAKLNSTLEGMLDALVVLQNNLLAK